MRALTHADTFLCPHGGPITVSPPAQSKLMISNQPVLLLRELKAAVVGCPAGPGRCNLVKDIINPASLRTTISGEEPVMQGATVLTDRGRAIPIPAPGPKSWRLGPAPSFSPKPAAIQCLKREERKDGSVRGLAPGVYLAGRNIKGLAGATHQFLLLVPGPAAKFDEVQNLAKGSRGLTVGGHSSDQASDITELIERKDFLVAKKNEDSDVSAVREWLGKPVADAKWNASLCQVVNPPDLTPDEFIGRILRAFDHYKENAASAPIEYPLLGGVIVHLTPDYQSLIMAGRLGSALAGGIGATAAVVITAGMILNTPLGRCFNSNSWAHGILDVVAGTLPPGATDLNGLDLCYENSIPPYYFLDNKDRIKSAKKRREFKLSANDPARRLVETASAVVKAVINDPSIQNKAEVVIEDLRVILVGGSPQVEAEPLNPDALRDLLRFTLALRAGAVGATRDSLIETCLAGLVWGYYSQGFAWLLPDSIALIRGADTNLLLFMLASTAGASLRGGTLRLCDLPAHLEAILIAATS